MKVSYDEYARRARAVHALVARAGAPEPRALTASLMKRRGDLAHLFPLPAEQGAKLLRAYLAATVPKVTTLDGRETLLVPVVALVANATIHAINAPTPEYVPAHVLAANPSAWNGKPAMLGHPQQHGIQCSADAAGKRAAQQIGVITNARMDANKLRMDLQIDAARLQQLDAPLLQRLRLGEHVEVSVGAFVQTSEHAGVVSWASVDPDHLALLAHACGACSVAAGCGTRAARAAQVFAQLNPVPNHEVTMNPQIANLKEATATIAEETLRVGRLAEQAGARLRAAKMPTSKQAAKLAATVSLQHAHNETHRWHETTKSLGAVCSDDGETDDLGAPTPHDLAAYLPPDGYTAGLERLRTASTLSTGDRNARALAALEDMRIAANTPSSTRTPAPRREDPRATLAPSPYSEAALAAWRNK